MAISRVQIEGMDEVRRMLREGVPKEVRATMREAVTTSTRGSTQLTQQNAPYETGALRQAIDSLLPKGKSLTGHVIIKPGEFRGRHPAAYVIPLEYGHGARAHPFIRSTAEQYTPRFIKNITDAGKDVERNLDRIGSRNL